MIATKMTEAECAALHNAADEAGKAAALNTKVFGGCGFAWVVVKPANCRFARWLNTHGHASKSQYEGGMKLWVSNYGQNAAAKYAYASAYSDVVEKAGVKCHADSRLD